MKQYHSKCFLKVLGKLSTNFITQLINATVISGIISIILFPSNVYLFEILRQYNFIYMEHPYFRQALIAFTLMDTYTQIIVDFTNGKPFTFLMF